MCCMIGASVVFLVFALTFHLVQACFISETHLTYQSRDAQQDKSIKHFFRNFMMWSPIFVRVFVVLKNGRFVFCCSCVCARNHSWYMFDYPDSCNFSWGWTSG